MLTVKSGAQKLFIKTLLKTCLYIRVRPIYSFVQQAGLVSMKWKHRHFDFIFINGCTESCHFNNFWCSQWWKCIQIDNISVSVRLTCVFSTPNTTNANNTDTLCGESLCSMPSSRRKPEVVLEGIHLQATLWDVRLNCSVYFGRYWQFRLHYMQTAIKWNAGGQTNAEVFISLMSVS